MRIPAAAVWGALGALAVPTACPAEPQALSPETVNTLLHLPLFADSNLWDDPAAQTAQRIGLPLESQTPDQASYRAYTGPNVQVAGSRPYTLALYAENGAPSMLSILFCNKGDFENIALLDDKAKVARARGNDKAAREAEKEREEVLKRFPGLQEKEAQALQALLEQTFGPPAKAKFGQSSDTREKVLRWDWNGHAFLLSVQDGEYVSLRLIPSALADTEGAVEKMAGADLKKKLAERVERRKNGDTVVAGIPMVDQGPKGYCVPATWERYLRYMGIPADMYILAMAGGTQAGGGTSIRAMCEGAERLVRKNGRAIDTVRADLSPKNISRYIDDGLPVMWTMCVNEPLNAAISARSALRAQTSDWEQWKASLKPFRKNAAALEKPEDNAHLCMIIGYNQETGELATSDSWGPEFAERWMTVEEAERISLGDLRVIKW
jgi:hypothetical protein